MNDPGAVVKSRGSLKDYEEYLRGRGLTIDQIVNVGPDRWLIIRKRAPAGLL
jgi:hypothetical protein